MNQSGSKDGECLLNVFTSEKVEHTDISVGIYQEHLLSSNERCVLKPLFSHAQSILYPQWQGPGNFFLF